MEIGALLGHLILWLDSRFQKPLRRAVPDLDLLLANPADYVSCQDIHIRPWRRWAGGIGLGLLLWFGFAVGSGILLALAGGNAGGRADAVRYALMLVTGPVWLVIGVYRLRGGCCVLNASGVTLTYSGTEVFCPWSLFAADGQPVIHALRGRNRLELPVAAAAVALVEARRADMVVARGMAVQTRQLYFRSPQEAILKSLYAVQPEELAWLLLRLGRSLGSAPSAVDQPVEEAAGEAPLATRDGEGWITVRLTRLAFPPWCCNCGTPTTRTQALLARTPLLRLGRFLNLEGEEHVSVLVPTCEACERGIRSRRRRAFWKPFLIVLGSATSAGFAWGTLVALLDRDPKLFPALPLALAFAGAVLSVLFAWFLGKRAAGKVPVPVELRRYFPERGTVALRFRRPAYAEQVLRGIPGGFAPGVRAGK